MKKSRESKLVSLFGVSIEDISQTDEDCMIDFSKNDLVPPTL
jgi:hypothetical protein